MYELKKLWADNVVHHKQDIKEFLKHKDAPVNVLSYNINDLILPAFDYLFDPQYYSVNEIYMFGSRKSAKTKHQALRMIYRILTDPNYNGLAMRKVASEIMDSIKEELQWAINMLGVNSLFEFKVAARVFIYKPTGQKIALKGISINPSSGKPSLSGLGVEKGWFKEAWLEEAWEFTYDDYKMIRQTLRGGEYTLTITGNPYFESIWCVRNLIKILKPDLQILKDKGQQWIYVPADRAKKRRSRIGHWNNFQINTKLSQSDIDERWEEEVENPKDFITTGYGYPGSPSGTILGDLVGKIEFVDMDYVIANTDEYAGGVDVGITNDATAAVFGGITLNNDMLPVGEYYHSNGDKECNEYSNGGVWRQKDPDELAIDVVEFFAMYKDLYINKQNIMKISVDSADRAFLKILNNKARLFDYDFMKFVPTIGKIEGKKRIESRIIFERQILAHHKFKMLAIMTPDELGKPQLFKACPRLLYELNNLPWKINLSNGKAVMERDDSKVPDHLTNAWEYWFRRWMTRMYKSIQ